MPAMRQKLEHKHEVLRTVSDTQSALKKCQVLLPLSLKQSQNTGLCLEPRELRGGRKEGGRRPSLYIGGGTVLEMENPGGESG